MTQALCSLGELEHRAGRNAQAAATLAEARKHAESVPGIHAGISRIEHPLLRVVQALIFVHDAEEALLTAEKVPRDLVYTRESALTAVAVGAAEEGRTPLAMAAANRIEFAWMRVAALREAARRLPKAQGGGGG